MTMVLKRHHPSEPAGTRVASVVTESSLPSSTITGGLTKFQGREKYRSILKTCNDS